MHTPRHSESIGALSSAQWGECCPTAPLPPCLAGLPAVSSPGGLAGLGQTCRPLLEWWWSIPQPFCPCRETSPALPSLEGVHLNPGPQRPQPGALSSSRFSGSDGGQREVGQSCGSPRLCRGPSLPRPLNACSWQALGPGTRHPGAVASPCWGGGAGAAFGVIHLLRETKASQVFSRRTQWLEMAGTQKDGKRLGGLGVGCLVQDGCLWRCHLLRSDTAPCS